MRADPRVEDLALCRDSWLDWKSTAPSKLESFGAFLRSDFAHNENDAFFTPKSAMTIDGLKVTQVFPGSVGMGLGFSVLVDATFDVAKQAFERELGRPLRDCETSDGMRTCENKMPNSVPVIFFFVKRAPLIAGAHQRGQRHAS